MWRKILSGFVVTLLLAGLFQASANALTTTTSANRVTKMESPLIITGYAFTHAKLDYVQIYNNSDTVQSLDGWSISYETDSASSPINLSASLSGQIAPSKYVIVADESLGLSGPGLFEYNLSASGSGTVENITLSPPTSLAYLDETVETPSTTASSHICGGDVNQDMLSLTRNISTTSGNYVSGFCYFSLADSPLFKDSLYEPPTVNNLQITEVLPNSRSCSPLVISPGCSDYVKLYNPTNSTIDLSQFRLRDGYAGQNISSSNTQVLSGEIKSGHYSVVPMDIINSGDWLWLEDAYGLKAYDNTVVKYPSAGTTRQGQAWAYNDATGAWQWTSTPEPYDHPSIFTTVTESPGDSVSLKPCAPDQFRNPATNRCKKISTTTSDLKPCAADQYRNPATNRCKKLTTASSSLVPCDAGEQRNPETNRCRKTSSNASKLVPCKPGQKRNPATNRCRKVSTGGGALDGLAQPATIAQTSFDPKIIGLVSIAVIGYGSWEYRSEIVAGWNRLVKLITRS